MPNPHLTTLNQRGVNIGLWDASNIVAYIRWDQLRLEEFHLSRRNRELVTVLLRRVAYLEEKFDGSEKALAWAESESKALKWAIASILFIAGEIDAPAHTKGIETQCPPH